MADFIQLTLISDKSARPKYRRTSVQYAAKRKTKGRLASSDIYRTSSMYHAERNFYRTSYSIFGKVGRAASEEVVLHLIKTKCLPVLLYGLEVCSLTKAYQHSFDFAVIRFLMKLFCTSNMVIINACLSYFDFRLPSELLLKRYEKYLVKKGLP